MAKKKTHEKYISEVAIKNPNIEVIGKYSGAHTKILHKCKIDGYEWECLPNNIIKGHGCPKCSGNAKKTHEEYVEELHIKNPIIRVMERYSGARTKILHHCLKHDVYWKTYPETILNGSGCHLCMNEKIAEKNSMSHDEYINELKQINSNVVVLGEYVNMKTQILHKCLLHNYEWMTMPESTLQGCGCPKCRSEKIAEKQQCTHEEYVQKLKEVNKNIIPIESYIKANTPILHQCLKDNHKWMATPANILYGYGCPKCNESKGEKRISLLLDENNIEYECQKCFDDCKDIKPLPFDFYLPKLNKMIEYDGKQHYEPIDFFGGQEYWEYIQRHDEIKNQYCKDNNIQLLRIPYYKNVDEELNNFLFI